MWLICYRFFFKKKRSIFTGCPKVVLSAAIQWIPFIICLSFFFLFVCVCSRYERPRLKSMEFGHFPSLPAPRHHDLNVQFDIVTQWQSPALFFNLLIFVIFVLFSFFSCFLEVNMYYFAVLVCGYEAARELTVLSDSLLKFFTFFCLKSVLTFLTGWKQCLISALFMNDADALLPFMCQSSCHF